MLRFMPSCKHILTVLANHRPNPAGNLLFLLFLPIVDIPAFCSFVSFLHILSETGRNPAGKSSVLPVCHFMLFLFLPKSGNHLWDPKTPFLIRFRKVLGLFQLQKREKANETAKHGNNGKSRGTPLHNAA